MNYKPGPEAWMSFLYGEMDAKEAEQMRQYLSENPHAQQEYEGLQQSRDLMQSIQSPKNPPVPLALMEKKEQPKWYLNRWLHSVAAGIALLLCAKLIGVQIQYQENTFSIRFGIPEQSKENQELEDKIALLERQNEMLKQTSQPDSLLQAIYSLKTSFDDLEKQNQQLAWKMTKRPGLNETQIADLKEEIGDHNYQMVLSLLSQAQQYQQAYTEELLGQFSQFLEQQRQQDLKLMEIAFNQIIEQNDNQQEETKYLLEELMTQISD